jgi:glycosyltransferase involved in cell wall biosynthesis
MTRRVRALFHTLLGVYYALLLEKHRVDHIHVHHGYFSSWIAMVAARLLGISFSVTLHGSDLLVHRSYLDVKLKHCKFCVTVSEFNRRYIFANYPEIEVSKIIVQHIGVDDFASKDSSPDTARSNGYLDILAVGRLHPIKDHAFLLQACHELRKRSIRFTCTIAGEGPERIALQGMIVELKLENEVQLLGHLSRERLDILYIQSNLVVLTSRSEGIPLVLMEAMSHRKLVLAPAITGIPDLVVDGKTGFLYRPGSLEHFAERVQYVSKAHASLESMRDAARQHVSEHFNRKKNLAKFSRLFIERIVAAAEPINYENPLLQQVQLSVQRH